LRESPALHIAAALKSQGYDVIAVEPNIKSHEQFELVTLDEALQTADVFAVLVKHRQFLVPMAKQQLADLKAVDFCGITA
jgi:UDP-N-acetyl-D-mannosaminuronic acid dehydrogenase